MSHRAALVNLYSGYDEEVVPVTSEGEEDGGCGDLGGYLDDGAYCYAHKDPEVLSRVLSRKYSMLED